MVSIGDRFMCINGDDARETLTDLFFHDLIWLVVNLTRKCGQLAEVPDVAAGYPLRVFAEELDPGDVSFV